MCRRLWKTVGRWAGRRENVTWLGILYSAVFLGMFCCAADQTSGPLGDVATRLLADAMASWFSVTQPALARWIVTASTKSTATTVIRLLRRFGLF